MYKKYDIIMHIRERKNMKQLNLFTFTGALLLTTNFANAASIYDNNISALNINILTDTFMSYTNYGAKLSDLFENRAMYGKMDRLDEYGDDGSTIKSVFNTKKHNNSLFDNVWGNANHINADMHYGNSNSRHARFNLATIGATTRAIDLKYGNLSFGGFASYINTKVAKVHSNGDAVGVFAHYKFRNLSATTLTNVGALNNNINGTDFNNSWVNVATDATATFKIDDTLFVKPSVYVAYTFVASDDLYLNNQTISSKDYHFFNIAPAVSFIKEISPNWYGALSAKYVQHFGGKNDIEIDDNKIDGLYLDGHTDIGIDVEHNFKQFVFGARIHKQIGDMDAWSTNINVKYVF